jgi:transposase
VPAVRKYPPDVMDNAVRMVMDIRRQDPQRAGVVGVVGDLMGIHPEVLRHWVKKAEPAPTPAAVPTEPAAAPGEERVQSLERENADLRRANAVLKAAAVMFAAELQHNQAG